jgi:hypothetical protein
MTVAVAGFFLLAGVGYLSDVPLYVCGLRALAGAAVLYVMTSLAGKVILRILVDAIMRNRNAEESTRENTGR